ncbi:MAG: tRNA lysidine(34) synthetase TilS [Candidatus Moraniibacteriota bacterium]|nr:MAG: tRNA lysidine(34) synthetase TilS [Candidatus Moranbacteria bacterium]
MPPLIKNIEATANRFELWRRGDRILVAVSGGPDSKALLHLLVSLATKYRLTLHVAHVNYGLRGTDSDEDEQLVREETKKYGIPLSVLRTKEQENAPERSTRNLEEVLRTIRYRFFEELREKYDCHSIALGHTEDDQAETVLLRLIRGASLEGLRGMKPKNSTIIRPLLFTTKEKLRKYLEKHHIPFRIDTSNADLRFARNRIRHELLPVLQKLNPNIHSTLARSALCLESDAEALDFFTQKFFHHETSFVSTDSLSIDQSRFLDTPVGVRRIFLRNLLKARDTLGRAPSWSEVEEMRKFFEGHKNKESQKSFRGLKLVRKGGKVAILEPILNSKFYSHEQTPQEY